MTVELDHTIVPARDKAKSAAFLAEVLGLPAPQPMGPFVMVTLGHGLSFDFADTTEDDVRPVHFAFRVDEARFDAAFERIRALDLPYWADPHQTRPGELGRRGSGRAFYFHDPDGHYLELISQPTTAPAAA